MIVLPKDMSHEDMEQVCSKALTALLEDGMDVTLDHAGHRYIVHKDGEMLVVALADNIPNRSDTMLWDVGFTGKPEAYLGI